MSEGKGQRFLDLLSVLECPDVKRHVPESFDWTFEESPVLPFLNWFLDNITAANALSPEQLDKYKILEANASVLKGSHLVEALSLLDKDKVPEMTKEEMRVRTEALQKEEECLDSESEALQVLINKLSIEVQSTKYRTSKMERPRAKERQAFGKIREHAALASRKLEGVLNVLGSTSQSLCDRYRECCEDVSSSSTSRNGSCPPLFLQLPLDSYYRAEEEYTRGLEDFTRQVFTKDSVTVENGNDSAFYEVIQVCDPRLLTMSGERRETIQKQQKEMDRLQQVYKVSKLRSIKAHTRLAQYEAQKRLVEIKLDDPLRSLADPVTIRSELDRVLGRQAMLRRKLAVVKDVRLPDLLSKSETAHQETVLTGDCHFKLTRQKRVLHKQEELLSRLCEQWSRQELLVLLMEQEIESHLGAGRELEEAGEQLKTDLKRLAHHQAVMDRIKYHQSKYERDLVDSTDTLWQSIGDVLGIGGASHKFVTYGVISKAVSASRKFVDTLKNNTKAIKVENTNHLVALVTSIKGLCGEMFSESEGIIIRLTPPQLSLSMSQLEVDLQTLAGVIRDAMADITHKRKMLSTTPLLAAERQLFTAFFANPSELAVVEENLQKSMNR